MEKKHLGCCISRRSAIAFLLSLSCLIVSVPRLSAQSVPVSGSVTNNQGGV